MTKDEFNSWAIWYSYPSAQRARQMIDPTSPGAANPLSMFQVMGPRTMPWEQFHAQRMAGLKREAPPEEKTVPGSGESEQKKRRLPGEEIPVKDRVRRGTVPSWLTKEDQEKLASILG
jgi:hypothetical protein